MRKRLAMSGALIHRPKLFLMDEPFEGVDAVGARLMKDILIDQVRRGATVFLTSHVLEVVERLCDQVAIINRGKVLVQGRIDDLRQELHQEGNTLEDIFVQMVGAHRRTDSLDWL
jgi:ABC-2 type transport system ATP-binding protein